MLLKSFFYLVSKAGIGAVVPKEKN